MEVLLIREQNRLPYGERNKTRSTVRRPPVRSRWMANDNLLVHTRRIPKKFSRLRKNSNRQALGKRGHRPMVSDTQYRPKVSLNRNADFAIDRSRPPESDSNNFCPTNKILLFFVDKQSYTPQKTPPENKKRRHDTLR